MKVTVESTPGSVFNINSIMAGDIQFGIVQSDIQYQPYKGLGTWENIPQEDIRAVFSIQLSTVSLI